MRCTRRARSTNHKGMYDGRVDHDLRRRLPRALPVARRNHRRALPPGRTGQLTRRDRAQPPDGDDQRCPGGGPLRPGRWPTPSPACSTPASAATRTSWPAVGPQLEDRSLVCLPSTAVGGTARCRGSSTGFAGRRDRDHPSPPARRGHHRVRRGRAARPHGPRSAPRALAAIAHPTSGISCGRMPSGAGDRRNDRPADPAEVERAAERLRTRANPRNRRTSPQPRSNHARPAPGRGPGASRRRARAAPRAPSTCAGVRRRRARGWPRRTRPAAALHRRRPRSGAATGCSDQSGEISTNSTHASTSPIAAIAAPRRPATCPRPRRPPRPWIARVGGGWATSGRERPGAPRLRTAQVGDATRAGLPGPAPVVDDPLGDARGCAARRVATTHVLLDAGLAVGQHQRDRHAADWSTRVTSTTTACPLDLELTRTPHDHPPMNDRRQAAEAEGCPGRWPSTGKHRPSDTDRLVTSVSTTRGARTRTRRRAPPRRGAGGASVAHARMQPKQRAHTSHTSSAFCAV